MIVLQAIITRYVEPGPVRGGRIIVKCPARRIIVPWNHEFNIERNHWEAAMYLVRQLEWEGKWHMGATVDGYAFVREV